MKKDIKNCSTCRWWKIKPNHRLGTCEAIDLTCVEEAGADVNAIIFSPHFDGIEFQTAENFCCAFHEVKPND